MCKNVALLKDLHTVRLGLHQWLQTPGSKLQAGLSMWAFSKAIYGFVSGMISDCVRHPEHTHITVILKYR